MNILDKGHSESVILCAGKWLPGCYYITVTFRKIGLLISLLINRFKDKSDVSLITVSCWIVNFLLMKEAYP